MSDIELYITNTETIYPRRDNNVDEVVVRLYGRRPDGAADAITVYGFEPYFYVPAGETDQLQPKEHDKLVRYDPTEVIPLRDRFKPPEEQRELAKVVVTDPGGVPELRKQWDVTWGADVLFTNRLRIDKGLRTGVRAPSRECRHEAIEAVELTDVAPRILFFDIETDDRATGFPEPGDARILSIAAYDNYSDEYVTFLDTDHQPPHAFFDVPDDTDTFETLLSEPTSLNCYQGERRMLMKFAQYVQAVDPDIITGWNAGDDANDGFDLPHLIGRMSEQGVNVGRLSREGYAKSEDIGDGEWRVEIKGRTTYDLMDAWVSTKFTKPDSKRLNDVAQAALDDAKIEHPDLGYFEMYEQDPVRFVDYNTKDTRLTVEINLAENVFGFKKRLREMIGVDWEETRENNEFVEMSVRRKCREHGVVMVTAWDNPHVREANSGANDDEVNYEGAFVFEAFEGLKHNVVGKDLASLYPMTQAMLNASPDTKIDRAKAIREDIPHVVAENGACFRTDVDSIIKELVDEYDEIKMSYKRELEATEYGTAEYESLEVAYGTTKTIYNSYYGYTGWDKSPLYDPAIAAAVTLTGQAVIKETAEYINTETAAEVVYGDTDSNYAEYPPDWPQERVVAEAKRICAHLNEEVYPALCPRFNIDPAENRWEIELEMLADRFFMSGQKKFYAYRSMWSEGMAPGEKVKDGAGSITIKGYACKKSNFAEITKETQRAVLEAILDGADKQAIADIVFAAACSIDPTDPDWDRIGMPQGLGKKLSREKADLEDFYAWSQSGDYPKSAHPRGAWFANHLLDVKFGKGSQPKRCYLKETLTVDSEPVDVICYDDHYDLEPVADDLQMDVTKMQNKVLVNPMQDILEAFGLEMDAALQGKAHSQAGLGAFG